MDLSLLRSGRKPEELPLRVTFYARVSTQSEDQLHSLRAQTAYYEDYIRRNPLWTYVPGYWDEGISGTSAHKREGFLRMIRDGEAGEFDFILTKEISRFSRNTLDSLSYTRRLLGCGVGVRFENDGICTLEGDAELRLTILSSIAQEEVRKTSERVRFGFRRAMENGVVLGNSAIWGYRKDRGRLVVDEKQAEGVRLLFELYANEGLGLRAAANELARRGYRSAGGNPLSCSTVRNILTNPKYQGEYCGRKTEKQDYRTHKTRMLPPEEWIRYQDESGLTVPPIVEPELWERANRILSARSPRTNQKTGGCFPLTGRIRCGLDGEPYTHVKRCGKSAWVCTAYKNGGRKACTSPVLYTAEAEAAVLKILPLEDLQDRARRSLPEVLSAACGKKGADLAKRRSVLEKKRETLLDLAAEGYLTGPEFARRDGELTRELWELDRREQDGDLSRLLQGAESVIQSPPGLSAGLVAAAVDAISVYPDGEEALRLVLETGPEKRTLRLVREEASFCFASSI